MKLAARRFGGQECEIIFTDCGELFPDGTFATSFAIDKDFVGALLVVTNTKNSVLPHAFRMASDRTALEEAGILTHTVQLHELGASPWPIFPEEEDWRRLQVRNFATRGISSKWAAR